MIDPKPGPASRHIIDGRTHATGIRENLVDGDEKSKCKSESKPYHPI